MHYLSGHGTRSTPQSTRARGDQVENSAGGFVWQVDPWTRLRRFLILGSQGGAFYIGEQQLTAENVAVVHECAALDGMRAVDEVVSVSLAGRAPKNDPAILALAILASNEQVEVRQHALQMLPQVCRIGTHLFMFAEFVEQFRGWGPALRKAVAAWYEGRTVPALAYQLVKYQQRGGWSHRDLLRLSHPSHSGREHQVLYEWVVRGTWDENVMHEMPRLAIVEGFERAKAAKTVAEVARLVDLYNLPREAIPTEYLGEARIWLALLENEMPLTAMIRNLGNMTRLGALAPMTAYTRIVTATLADREKITRSRVHPLTILNALRTYQSGRGFRGQHSWTPLREIVDALDVAFYLSFGNVKATGKKMMLAIDVSGSMRNATIAGTQLTAREAAAAMALVTANVEPHWLAVGFYAGLGGKVFTGRSRIGGYRGELGITPLDISPRQRLDDVVRTISRQDFGGTDCALPMLYAEHEKLDIDAFVIYTDSETWAGDIHPHQAIRRYRERGQVRSDAKLIVVGMTSNGFTIADPNDPGMLDVVGFDTATPNVISDFVGGSE